MTAASLSAQAQQPAPAVAPVVPAAPVATLPALSEDSVRVMTGLVQASVRQLHNIYFEPNDTRAVQLIEAALVEVPAMNKRLSFYTASLPREQQQVLAQRLRQQPWQVELQTLQRSPQYREFSARAAKNPALKKAFEHLQAAGFMGTAKAATPAASAATPPVAVRATPAAPTASTAPVKPLVAKPAVAPTKPTEVKKEPATSVVAKAAPANPAQHRVQKGDTLFGICRKYGVTPAQIRAWNNKKDDGVKIGEVLLVKAAQ
ncbi:LysM peptidoglycan-binding domain-containing protein [Hymenobacter sp. BT730]|uniref:LysM peptidoglycan-binding domain-containing protein n=1 Tax=Hymenobacter sp. BT730 TaxID=3063332 RepID=UPI0026E05A90|nr:LysM peptidoglycan-binding domain-containing protein [Hymenobacter sp. BT730]